MSKKVLMLLGTILGDCLVLVLYHYWPEVPEEVVRWVIGGISGAGIGGVLGQGLADGLSRGLTSSQGKRILDAQRELQGFSRPADPPAGS